MARQLPTRPDRSIERSTEPSVVYVNDQAAASIVSALSSESGMAAFRLLTGEPHTASELADALGVTVQNAGYHLENLQAADLVEVVDTCYSEKGREMDIYAVTRDPKILVLASEAERSHLQNALTQMVGAVGLSGVLLATWQYLAGVVEGLFEM